MEQQRTERRHGYAVALLVTAVTVAVRWAFWPVFGDAVPHQGFLPAVLVAAYYGGLRPGLLATLLAAFIANYALTAPYFVLGIKSVNAAVALPLFLGTGLLISGLCESLHRTRRRLVAEERERAAAALAAAEARFLQLAENTRDIYWSIGAGGRATYVSPAYEEVWGRTRESLYARDPEDWVDDVLPDDRPAAAAAFRRVRAGERTDFEFRVVRPDGGVRWVRLRSFPVADDAAGGRVAGLCEDITERKRDEHALRDSEAQFRFLANAMPHIVWTARPDGTSDYINDRFVEYTGQTVADRIGDQWIALFHPDDREETARLWAASVAAGAEHDIEFRLRAAAGGYRWFKSRGLPVRDGSGRVVKWVGTTTDIEQHKRAELALEQARDAAEAANRAKDEFLANVSHEIRTPMNAILGMTELVLDTELRDDQRQCLRTVKSAADNLLGVLNDLLDFSKIEAGKLELDPSDFSLRAVLGDTLRALATRAHQKGVELVAHVRPDVRDALVGDAGRFRQVLLNLIGNAIKFTPRGEVAVRVERAAGEGDGDGAVRVEVRDTGIGIRPEVRERIFKAFEQADTSTTRRYGGTGLGLPIAARLVELMGGAVTVESEPGRGSTFAFTARFDPRPCGGDAAPAPVPVSLRGLRVLVVDDNATNRQILEEVLRGWQVDPHSVGDAVAATGALWHAVAEGHPFPLVLLDARMPGTDGLALAARIREWPALAATKIIVLTSGDRLGDTARLRELRIDAHLLKPVAQSELLDAIFRVMSRADAPPIAPAPPAAAPSEPAPVTPSHRVLVAEDNEFNAQLVEQLLARRGHRTRVVGTGREALELAAAGGFDALLLDLHLPELDGFQVVRALRTRERGTGAHLPVVALTARSRPEDRDRCLAAGMDEFLTKPVHLPDLLATLDRVTRPRPVAAPVQVDAPLSPAVLLAACEGDRALLGRLCHWFAERAPAHVAALAAAREAPDLVRLRETAHKLSGMLATFSTAAGDLASAAEDRAAAGERDAARDLAARVEAATAELLRTVAGLTLEELLRLAERPAPTGGTGVSNVTPG